MSELLAVPTTDDAALATELWRGEGTPIVLLHAGVADRRAWREVAGALHAAGATVVAYDRRGFGQTPATEATFRHVDDLRAVVDAVAPSDGPAHLVGNSQGGLIALDLALAAPQRVATLTLIAPAVSGEPQGADDALDPATLAISARMDAAEEEDDLEAMNALEIRLWLDGPSASEGRVGAAVRDLAIEMNGVALAAAADEDAGAGGADAWSRLEEIAVPATVAWGALDVPLVIERCRVLAERLPDVRAVREWPDVAHLPGLERPDLVTALVAEAVGLQR
jgi:pimeloyl-ACP methyl ester carboxylesterase